MAQIKRFFRRLGIFPYLILGSGFATLGLVALDYITQNLWVIDVAQLDLVRQVAQDRANSPALLDAAYLEIVLAFLMSTAIVLIGLFLPIAYLLNKRFNTHPPIFFASLRQAMWVGLWAAFCLWLQMNRTLNIPIALLLVIVFGLLETILQIRSRTAVGLHFPQTPIRTPKPTATNAKPTSPAPKREKKKRATVAEK